ncbi:hypothetical protein [Thalassiella azotivora]
MAEEHPEQVADVQHRLQQIVVSVARTHSKAPVDDVEQTLRMAMDGAAIPEQPEKWVRDTAIEIASGRIVVMNAHEQDALGIPRDALDREIVDPQDPGDTTS